MKKGERKCAVCKDVVGPGEFNGFGECYKEDCYGTFMKNLRKGDPPLFPEVKKKKGGFGRNVVKKKGGTKTMRNYAGVKPAVPFDEAPPEETSLATQEEERSLASKV
jgi:hypothetical protein